jgi:dTDP-4-dehydrorhamnose reductase
MARTMLVTGGHGFLGRRVVRCATEAGWDVVAPTSVALDIRSAAALETLTNEIEPSAVIHLAYRRTERDTIVDGSRLVAEAAHRVGARLVHLSSDVVFAGRETTYVETDPTSPVEPYGAAKADAEIAVRAVDHAAVLVRTSLLLGDPADLGQSEIDVLKAAVDPSSFTFFADEYRSPARAADVARAVVALAADRSVDGPLHLGGPECLSRFELARELACQLDVDPQSLCSTTLEAVGLAGRRPGRVELDSSVARSLGLAPESVRRPRG